MIQTIMKKIASIFTLVLITILGLSSCNDSREPQYELIKEPVMVNPTGDYVLKAEAADFIMETFSWSRGEYNYEAGPIYTLEASANKLFEADSTVEMSSTNTPFSSVKVGQMNKIMKQWNKPVDVSSEVYFRVKAGLAISGLNTIDVYSKPIVVTITPYFMKDPVKAPLYLVGNITDPAWTNNSAAVGTGLISMFATDNSTKDQVYTYTGFFKAGSEFKMIGIAGSWDPQYGLDVPGKLSTSGGSGNIPITEAGYYTLTADLKELTYSTEKYDMTGKTPLTNLGIVGDFTGWADGGDAALVPLSYDPYILRATITLAEDGNIKIRQDGKWDNNWGSPTKGSYPIPFGKLSKGGEDIPLAAGKYYVQVNTLTLNTAIIAQ